MPDVLVPVLRLGIPDVLVDHASPEQSKEALGLTPPQMAARILERFGTPIGAGQGWQEHRPTDDRRTPVVA